MKPIKQIKTELRAFGKSYNACEKGIKAIKGNNLKELFENIGKYIIWCKETPEKKKVFNAIFDNELVIGDGILLCNCSNLTSIIIPNYVTSIEKDAFYGCIELTSIIISNSITSIENYTFLGCGELTSVTIPTSVTSIGNYAFANCSKLTSIIIPNSVVSIEEDAFGGCREDLQIIRK